MDDLFHHFTYFNSPGHSHFQVSRIILCFFNLLSACMHVCAHVLCAGIELEVLHILGKNSTTELFFQPRHISFFLNANMWQLVEMYLHMFGNYIIISPGLF